MPRMPARLSITEPSDSHRYQPLRSSQLTVPPSPTSPKAPLHPPARLHLRPIITSSPPLPSCIAIPPDAPYPWIWRCHVCHSVYSLGVTRRCLEDGHFFCSLPNQNNSSPQSDPTESTHLSLEELVEKSKNEKRKRKKRSRQACRSEFDYAGWNRYNIWRREIHLIQAEENGISPTDDEPYLPNCWMECDFPSECHNTRLERLRAMRKVVEISRDQTQFSPQELEAEQEAMKFQVQIENMLEDNHPIDLVSLPLSAEEDVLETERRGLEGEANFVDLGVARLEEANFDDEMGVKEVEFVQKKRKKSIQKIQQLTGLTFAAAPDTLELESTLPSPLKMQFVPEDMEDVDLGEGENNSQDPQKGEFLEIRNCEAFEHQRQ